MRERVDRNNVWWTQSHNGDDPELPPGGYVTFAEWLAGQSEEMRERVRRIAPTLQAFGVIDATVPRERIVKWE
jgi:hypothetical protein